MGSLLYGNTIEAIEMPDRLLAHGKTISLDIDIDIDIDAATYRGQPAALRAA